MTIFSRLRCAWITASIVLLGSQAFATQQICRWTDEEGRTQISDQVPAKYKQTAKCTNSAQYSLTDAQRREAEARAQASQKALSAPDAKSSNRHEPVSPQDNTPRKLAPLSSTQECATMYRRYQESQACFAQFRIKNGGVRAEAYSHCPEILDPSHRCGPL